MSATRTGHGWPKWDEPEWWRRYWDDVRPRIVVLRIKTDAVTLRWLVPLWALEESLRFALLALPWIAYAWRWLPSRWRTELARPGRRSRIVIDSAGGPPWAALVALIDGHGEGMLRLASGEPFVVVEAGGARGVVVEVTQY